MGTLITKQFASCEGRCTPLRQRDGPRLFLFPFSSGHCVIDVSVIVYIIIASVISYATHTIQGV